MTQLPITPEFVQHLAGLVPTFACQISYAGPHHDLFTDALSARAHASVLSEHADQGSLDCVVFYLDAAAFDHFETLKNRLSLVSAEGRALIVVLPHASATPLSELETKLCELDFFIWGYDAITASGTSCNGSGYIAKVARCNYDPVRHARALTFARRPDWAFEILTQIPESMLQDPLVVAEVAANKIICTLAWDSKEGAKNRLARFFYSQVTFYDAASVAPLAHEPYLCHAEFWKRIGDPSMRVRLIRSARQAAVESVRQRIEEPAIVENSQRREFVPPEWRASEWKPRVLFILYPRPHYGLDVQYYGLCEVLGDENVVEYPFKPSLHGEKPDELAHYPCMFNRKGWPFSLEEILRQLERGEFDAVIYGDVEGFVDEQTMKAIRAAAGDKPIVLFDAQDDPLDQWEKVDAYIGGGLRLHFKREMLSCWDYGDRTVPMPFAYADLRIPASPPTARTTPVFWAGHRQFALRRLYLEQIEAKFGFDLRKSYKQEEYAAALCGSRIALNVFGFGYDTVRYWEIPAHGTMLLAECLPIDIPHNFVDGESAVFFDDLADLEQKLAYYIGHLEESAAIAARGHAHFLKYHTASARARQMLGWMQSRLFEGDPKWKV